MFGFLRRPAPTPPTPRTLPPEPLTPIGTVRNKIEQHMMSGWEAVVSEIVLRNDLAPGIAELSGFGRVTVVCWLDRVPEAGRGLLVQQPGWAQGKAIGVFATRSQNRPNPLGVAHVELLGVEGTVVRVRGLDALDGTPVLDLRPYLPPYDAFPDAAMPPWVWGR